jgi:hypothetical protein
MRLGFFAYPWDLLDEGVEAAIEQMVARCHCDSILLNANYHHARLLRPRATGPKTVKLPGAVAAFSPDIECYQTPLVPVADRRLVDGRVVARAREAAAGRGLDFGLWVLGLHNSTLGGRHPEFTMQNCQGDRYEYALCPSSEAVQAYLHGLVEDLTDQFRPERILLEAVGHLGLRHGVHHELFFVDWDEALELLFSLCFCDGCIGRAQQAGLDPIPLRRHMGAWAERLLAAERGGLGAEFGTGEAASLILEIPGLPEYLALRAETIAGLVARLTSAAHRGGTELEVIPASFHRPVSRAWFEGSSLRRLGPTCDGLLIPAYWPTARQVTADLQWATGLAPEARLSAGLNICDPSLSGPAAVTGLLGACETGGCAAVYHYNYGLLTEQRLGWVAAANQAAQAR